MDEESRKSYILSVRESCSDKDNSAQNLTLTKTSQAHKSQQIPHYSYKGDPVARAASVKSTSSIYTHEFLPFIIDYCCTEIEKHFVEFRGIHRICAVMSKVDRFMIMAETVGFAQYLHSNFEETHTPAVLSGILKRCLALLPGGLIPQDSFKTMELYYVKMKLSNSDYLFRKCVYEFSNEVKCILCRILSHFVMVSDHCETNGMTLRNLCTLFFPSLVRCDCSEVMNVNQYLTQPVEMLIQLSRNMEWLTVAPSMKERKASSTRRWRVGYSLKAKGPRIQESMSAIEEPEAVCHESKGSISQKASQTSRASVSAGGNAKKHWDLITRFKRYLARYPLRIYPCSCPQSDR